jgi:hypothetical protein
MNIYTDSTKERIKIVEKIKENIIAGEKVIEDVVKVVKPQYSNPTHTCFTFFNCVGYYVLAWWYNLPSIDACSKLNEEKLSTNEIITNKKEI